MADIAPQSPGCIAASEEGYDLQLLHGTDNLSLYLLLPKGGGSYAGGTRQGRGRDAQEGNATAQEDENNIW